MDNTIDYQNTSNLPKDETPADESADQLDESEWIERSKRDKKASQKNADDQVNDTTRAQSNRRDNAARSRANPSSTNTGTTSKTAATSKVFDGKNFVEAPLPVKNAWKRPSTDKNGSKNDSSTCSSDSGPLSSKEASNSKNTITIAPIELTNEATTVKSSKTDAIKPLSEIIVPTNINPEIKEVPKQKNKDASTTTTSPGKSERSLPRTLENTKNRARQLSGNSKNSKNRQDSESEKKPRSNASNSVSNQFRGRGRTESSRRFEDKEGATTTSKELNDSAHWPRLNKDEEINNLQNPAQNITKKSDKGYLPSSTPLSTATDTDGDNEAEMRVKEMRGNLRSVTPQRINTDSSGDDSSTKNDTQTPRDKKKKNLKWKRMEFDLPKTERKRRGGNTRPRSDGSGRDNKDRPPPSRRRDRGDRGDRERERGERGEQPSYSAKESDGKTENNMSSPYRRDKDNDNRQWSQDRYNNRGNMMNRGNKRSGYQTRPHYNSRTFHTTGNVYAPQVFEPSIQYFYSPVYFGGPAPPGTFQYYNTPPVYFETPHSSQIRFQIEYYFSKNNLETDFFIRRQMDAKGWVSLALLKTFKRVKELTNDDQIIIEAMTGSETVEVSMDRKKLRPKIHPERWTIAGSNPDSFSALKVDVAEFVPGRFSANSVKTQTTETLTKIDQGTSFSPKHTSQPPSMNQVYEISSTLNSVAISTDDK